MSSYLNQPACNVIGSLPEQYSAAEIVKEMLESIFLKKVHYLSINTDGFYMYDRDGVDITIEINGEEIIVTAKQQGLIAFYRYAAVRDLAQLTTPLFSQAQTLFGDRLYQKLFITMDWKNGPLYDLLRNARIA